MKTLIDLLKISACTYGEKTALSIRSGLRQEVWSYRYLWHSARAIADYLINHQGLNPGDRVLVSAANSPRLVAAYFGTMLARGILVPLDPASAVEFVRRVIDETQASAIISDGRLSEAPNLKIIRLTDLPTDAETAREPRDEPSEDDIVEIVFTSGTTGKPKGVILSHQNIVANVSSAATLMPQQHDCRFLSLLPLSHMLEQTVGLYLPIYSGATIHYPADRRSSSILKAIEKHRITTIVVVPQLLNLMIEAIERKIHDCGKGGWWRRTQSIAGSLPMPIRRRLFARVHRQLGGGLEFFICGGAHLPAQLAHRW